MNFDLLLNIVGPMKCSSCLWHFPFLLKGLTEPASLYSFYGGPKYRKKYSQLLCNYLHLHLWGLLEGSLCLCLLDFCP